MTDGREPEPTRPIDLGEETQPVDVSTGTAPFAPVGEPDDPVKLVSTAAADMLLADALPQPAGPGPAVPDPTPGIDSLFGESQFREYEPEPILRAPRPPEAPAVSAPARTPAPRAPRAPRVEAQRMTGTQRILLGVAAGLIALAVLAGLFVLGTRLPGTAAEPAASRSDAATPTPASTVLPPGPVAVGSHRWDQLLGGECIGDWTGPWAQRFTVVDCATPHPAQLVVRGWYPAAAAAAYPGAAAIQAQLTALCSASGVIDLAAASQYTDAQIETSYPATAAQWDAGDHWYYCFVTRSSKDQLTGSVAAAHPTPAPTAG